MADPRELELRVRDLKDQLDAAQSHLERTGKLALLGGLVSEIAHEINTPLTALRSNIDTVALATERLRGLIRSACGEPGRARELEELLLLVEESIKTSRLACERLSGIVQGLRGSPRAEETGRATANVEVEIENSLALLTCAFRKRIRLVKDYGALPDIEGSARRLSQVFLNILVNAVQAMEGEGEIRIRTRQDGDTVRVSISDTGNGMPPDVQARIFEPGFTTKSAAKGTGLGLFISHRIVQEHGGRIDVESEEGRGTTFTVVLPLRQTRERKIDGRGI